MRDVMLLKVISDVLVVTEIDSFLSVGDFSLVAGRLSFSAYVQCLRNGGVGAAWSSSWYEINIVANITLPSLGQRWL